MLKDKRDIGLLIIRLGLGVMFIFHGFPKITGGPEKWEKLGNAMGVIGIQFWPTLWGFLASVAEFAGGFFLMIGMFHTTFCFLIFFTMAVATLRHYYAGDGFRGYAHALELAFVFLGLIFTGPGKYSVGAKIFFRK
jgi:putative oxidoreductase